MSMVKNENGFKKSTTLSLVLKSGLASKRLESATSSDEERMNSELLLLSAARAEESPTVFVKAAKQTLT